MAGGRLPVSPKELHGLLRCFAEELDAEAAESGSQKAFEMRHPRLRTGVENGVAATDIGPDGVGFTDAIANGDAVAVARSTTGEVVFSLRKKGGEDAVLHVKHWDVLVEGELKPVRWGDAEKFENLADIEVVAGGEPFQFFGLEKVCGEGVGDIEGEVADHRQPGRAEVVEPAEVPDEDAVWLGILDQAEKACFTGLLAVSYTHLTLPTKA